MFPRYCKFFDRGYCLRKNECAFLHAYEICKSLSREECGKKDCVKRHPKMCKFGFNCRRAVCAFRHPNTSIRYVPGEDQDAKEQNVNILLLKSFVDAQGGDRAVKLSFFAKDGKASAIMETLPTKKNTEKNQTTIDSASLTQSTLSLPRSPTFGPFGTPAAAFASASADNPCSCSCALPTPLYSNPSICFWCKGIVELEPY